MHIINLNYIYETEWGRWNRLRNTSRQYDPKFSLFIDNSVGVFKDQELKTLAIQDAKNYEKLAEAKELKVFNPTASCFIFYHIFTFLIAETWRDFSISE